MPWLCRWSRFSSAAVEKTLALPLLQLVEKSVTFYGPSYLAVTCSAFAFGVQVHGLFWEMTSGCFPYSALLGSTVDTCYVRLRRPCGFHAEKLRSLRSCSFLMVVDIPFVTQRQMLMVQTVWRTIETSQLQYASALLCWSCSLLVVSRRAENCGFHSCISCLVVYMPVVLHDKFGVFSGPCTQVHAHG